MPVYQDKTAVLRWIVLTMWRLCFLRHDDETMAFTLEGMHLDNDDAGQCRDEPFDEATSGAKEAVVMGATGIGVESFDPAQHMILHQPD